jgi:hypothetical protein
MLKDNEHVVTIKVKKKLLAIIDSERSKYQAPRSSWIIQSIVERLERMGHEIPNEF